MMEGFQQKYKWSPLQAAHAITNSDIVVGILIGPGSTSSSASPSSRSHECTGMSSAARFFSVGNVLELSTARGQNCRRPITLSHVAGRWLSAGLSSQPRAHAGAV